jgi:DNA-directed RNA polymerase specialized sigma24 family protein
MTAREYNECVTRYADNVYRFILKNLGHEEDARDVVQSAFEKLWVNKDNVDNERSKSYLFTIAYNQMIDHIRKHKRVSLRDEFAEEVRIQDRPQHNMKKVLLKDYEGYSYDEIGEITGLNESQVKVYLHRARLQLKNYLVSIENVM